jgi:ATP-dependent Clp protease ATP-binding subunit ClpB
VRRRPYAVVLLDEIEKAHPDVFNVLLQIMDDGRLTDGKGRTVDFKNTVIIMTSNIGSQFLRPEVNLNGTWTADKDGSYKLERTSDKVDGHGDTAGSGTGKSRASSAGAYLSGEKIEQVMEALRQHFRPEFLNRVDDIVVFNPLGREQLSRIVELRLEDLRRMLADRKISIELTDRAKELIFARGYDVQYGARPLKRSIQRLIQDPLALKILDGEVLHGDHVVVDTDAKMADLTFKVSRHASEPVAK